MVHQIVAESADALGCVCGDVRVISFSEFLEQQDPDIADRKGTQPSKYYAGLKKGTKEKRDSHFKKQAAMSDDDPRAYEPAPGDSGKTRPSKHTKKYRQMFGEELEGLRKKSAASGIPYSILKKVYDRGMAAWRTGHRPGASQQQWAYARVNSFITGGKTRTTADADLWKKAKK